VRLSPSLGITYQASKDLLLKASVARGFHTAAPGFFIDYSSFFTWFVNHDLSPEKIWSYQVGAESNLKDIIWLKLVLFMHDISDHFIAIERGCSNRHRLNANEQRVYGGMERRQNRSMVLS
jgi:outer membrane receptor protein involved in Fe transport